MGSGSGSFTFAETFASHSFGFTSEISSKYEFFTFHLLVILGHLVARGAQGQVQETVGSWSSHNPIEGSDKKNLHIFNVSNV